MRYIYDVFLSYSTKDKHKVNKLYNSLKKDGYEVWLDEWEIKVGDQIPQKISDGVQRSRFVAIWLSKNSVSSNWVSEEWQSKYYSDIQNSRAVILPLLGEDCDIPMLLKPKKYADFRNQFSIGYSKLAKALESNSSKTIKLCTQSLIDGSNGASDYARILGLIVIRSNDEAALLSLWNATLKTKKPYNIIDHIVYYYTMIMLKSTNSEVKQKAFSFLEMSVKEADIVIDKYSYAAGDIVLESKDTGLREKVVAFIKKQLNSESKRVRFWYEITKKRIDEMAPEIFTKNKPI